ncbi:MAG: hypothetical protein J5628_03090 [Lachnospiraceae bacterium]|nr:hypothetical protein [Lachnospiraceae bacterium]
MSKPAQDQQTEKKGKSKKPLAAVVLLAALLGFGAYEGAKLYNNDSDETPKETITIEVAADTVKINDEVQKPAEGKTWKTVLEEYFAKKDLAKSTVKVNYAYGDYDLVKEIKDALSALNITTIETGGGT